MPYRYLTIFLLGINSVYGQELINLPPSGYIWGTINGMKAIARRDALLLIAGNETGGQVLEPCQASLHCNIQKSQTTALVISPEGFFIIPKMTASPEPTSHSQYETLITTLSNREEIRKIHPNTIFVSTEHIQPTPRLTTLDTGVPIIDQTPAVAWLNPETLKMASDTVSTISLLSDQITATTAAPPGNKTRIMDYAKMSNIAPTEESRYFLSTLPIPTPTPVLSESCVDSWEETASASYKLTFDDNLLALYPSPTKTYNSNQKNYTFTWQPRQVGTSTEHSESSNGSTTSSASPEPSPNTQPTSSGQKQPSSSHTTALNSLNRECKNMVSWFKKTPRDKNDPQWQLWFHCTRRLMRQNRNLAQVMYDLIIADKRQNVYVLYALGTAALTLGEEKKLKQADHIVQTEMVKDEAFLARWGSLKYEYDMNKMLRLQASIREIGTRLRAASEPDKPFPEPEEPLSLETAHKYLMKLAPEAHQGKLDNKTLVFLCGHLEWCDKDKWAKLYQLRDTPEAKRIRLNYLVVVVKMDSGSHIRLMANRYQVPEDGPATHAEQLLPAFLNKLNPDKKNAEVTLLIIHNPCVNRGRSLGCIYYIRDLIRRNPQYLFYIYYQRPGRENVRAVRGGDLLIPSNFKSETYFNLSNLPNDPCLLQWHQCELNSYMNAVFGTYYKKPDKFPSSADIQKLHSRMTALLQQELAYLQDGLVCRRLSKRLVAVEYHDIFSSIHYQSLMNAWVSGGLNPAQMTKALRELRDQLKFQSYWWRLVNDYIRYLDNQDIHFNIDPPVPLYDPVKDFKNSEKLQHLSLAAWYFFKSRTLFRKTKKPDLANEKAISEFLQRDIETSSPETQLMTDDIQIPEADASPDNLESESDSETDSETEIESSQEQLALLKSASEAFEHWSRQDRSLLLYWSVTLKALASRQQSDKPDIKLITSRKERKKVKLNRPQWLRVLEELVDFLSNTGCTRRSKKKSQLLTILSELATASNESSFLPASFLSAEQLARMPVNLLSLNLQSEYSYLRDAVYLLSIVHQHNQAVLLLGQDRTGHWHQFLCHPETGSWQEPLTTTLLESDVILKATDKGYSKLVSTQSHGSGSICEDAEMTGMHCQPVYLPPPGSLELPECSRYVYFQADPDHCPWEKAEDENMLVIFGSFNFSSSSSNQLPEQLSVLNGSP